MTIDTWVMIVQAIVALITLIFTIRAFRMNQPKQTPAASHPTSAIQRIAGWAKRFMPWVFTIFIVWNLVDLLSEMRSTRPLDRQGVLYIALPIASILVNLGVLAYLSLLKLWDDFLRSYTSAMNSIAGAMSSLNDSTNKLTNIAGTTTENVSELGKFDALVIDALKNLSAAIPQKPGPPERKD